MLGLKGILGIKDSQHYARIELMIEDKTTNFIQCGPFANKNDAEKWLSQSFAFVHALTTYLAPDGMSAFESFELGGFNSEEEAHKAYEEFIKNVNSARRKKTDETVH